MSKLIDLIKKLKPKPFGEAVKDPIGLKPKPPIKEPIPVPKDPTVKEK